MFKLLHVKTPKIVHLTETGSKAVKVQFGNQCCKRNLAKRILNFGICVDCLGKSFEYQ